MPERNRSSEGWEEEFRVLEDKFLQSAREYWKTIYKDDPKASKGLFIEISGANSMALFLGMSTDGTWYLLDVDLGKKPPIELLLYASTFLELNDEQLESRYRDKKLTELSKSPLTIKIPRIPESRRISLYHDLVEDMKDGIEFHNSEIQEYQKTHLNP